LQLDGLAGFPGVESRFGTFSNYHFSRSVGMRPGEIFGLKWRHVGDDGAVIKQRIYRRNVETVRSNRGFHGNNC